MGRIRILQNQGLFGSEDTSKEGINTIIQGSSSELVLSKMVQIWEVIRDTPMRMVLQVHDEVVYEVPKELLPQAIAIIEAIMPSYEHGIPFTVSIGIGDNWRDLEELGGSKERQMAAFRRRGDNDTYIRRT